MSFSIELQKDDIMPSLERLADDAEQVLDDALEAGATAMAARGQRAFDEPGLRPAPWPRLSERHYRKRRKKAAKRTLKGKKVRVQMLIDSGALYQGVQAQGNVFGANAPYAAAHQFGYDARNLPARPYLPVTEDGEELTKEANEEVLEVIAEAVEVLTK